MFAAARSTSSYDDLFEEIVWLRGLLGIEAEAEKLTRLARSFRVTPSQARFLQLLHARRGRVVTSAFLEEWTESPHRAHGSKIVDVQICAMRKRMGRDTIITHWGLGFSLAPLVVAQIDALFEDLA